MDIYTIGHSTHSQEEFIEILKTYDIELVVDIRSYPGSKYVPHFNKENMEVWMPDSGIKYIHMKELGGRRKAAKGIDMHFIDSDETLWDISQRYAVRMSSIYKINGLAPSYVPRSGDCIRLRK